MFQTIDRALTIYGNMSVEEQHIFLQAEPVHLSKESVELSEKCFDIMKKACEMDTERTKLNAIEFSKLTPHEKSMVSMYASNMRTHSTDQILRYVETECKNMYETYPEIIPAKRIPIFLSAMMYYIYGKLDSTVGTEVYTTVKNYSNGVRIPEIHISKCPANADGVMRLVNSDTETFKTISAETKSNVSRCTIS